MALLHFSLFISKLSLSPPVVIKLRENVNEKIYTEHLVNVILLFPLNQNISFWVQYLNEQGNNELLQECMGILLRMGHAFVVWCER